MGKFFVRLLLTFLSGTLLIFDCNCPNNVSGGGSEGEGRAVAGLHGRFVNQSAAPVENASVKVFRVDTAAQKIDSIAVDSTLTDTAGKYVFKKLSSATYNLEGNYMGAGETLYALIIGIKFDSVYDEGTDTLKAPGRITGNVVFDSKDKGKVFCYIPGSSYIAITDSAGNYEISNVPPGRYTIGFWLDGYVAVSVRDIEVKSAAVTTVPSVQLTVDPSLNPPTPKGLKAEYDAITGIVILSWDSVKVSDLAGYVVYRKDTVSSVPVRISGNRLVPGPEFRDTLFSSTTDTASLAFVYQVKAQDENNNESDHFSDQAIVVAAPPNRDRKSVV
jgi:hypothetical protein